jgi:hypothetical protein
MKTNKLQKLLAIAGLAPTVAFSQSSPVIYDTAQIVTFTLTESNSAPALIARDEAGQILRDENNKTYLQYENDFSTERGTIVTSTSEWSSKIVTSKISNKEVLEALVEAGVITDTTGIAGYSISFYSDVSPGSEGIAFHLVKAGMPARNISEYLFISEEGAEVENGTERTITTTNTTTDLSTERYTNTGNGKTAVELRFMTGDTDVKLRGVAAWSDTYREIGTGSAKRGLLVPGAASISSIVGESGDSNDEASPTNASVAMDIEEEEENENSLIEGRISMAAGTVLPVPAASPR